jgi:hypothetical protein
MTKKDLRHLSWIFIKCAFLIYITCVLLELNILILPVLIFIFIFIDLGVEFLKMVEDTRQTGTRTSQNPTGCPIIHSYTQTPDD